MTINIPVAHRILSKVLLLVSGRFQERELDYEPFERDATIEKKFPVDYPGENGWFRAG